MSTGHTGTYQAWERAPKLIVVTPELALALDNLLAVANHHTHGGAGGYSGLVKELAVVKALHDFERFNLGGEPR